MLACFPGDFITLLFLAFCGPAPGSLVLPEVRLVCGVAGAELALDGTGKGAGFKEG